MISQFVVLHKGRFKIYKRHVDRIFASFAAMDVNIALGLHAALVVLTSRPYNTEGMFLKTIVYINILMLNCINDLL